MEKLRLRKEDFDSLYDLEKNEYVISHYGDRPFSIMFRCPGCGEPMGINTGVPGDPKWAIDFNTLTAHPSILHSQDGKGCGWHGYLTNGLLIPC